VPKRLHRQRHSRPPFHSLPIAPSLAERVTTVAALQSRILTPGLDHRADRGNSEAAPLPHRRGQSIIGAGFCLKAETIIQTGF